MAKNDERLGFADKMTSNSSSKEHTLSEFNFALKTSVLPLEVSDALQLFPQLRR